MSYRGSKVTSDMAYAAAARRAPYNKALIVGVTKWPRITWESPEAKNRAKHLGDMCEENLLLLGETLAERCGYDAVEVHLPEGGVTSDDSSCVRRELRNRVKVAKQILDKATIIQLVEDFVGACDVGRRSRVFLYLCSHGFVRNDTYFFCPETAEADEEKKTFNDETMLSADEIKTLTSDVFGHSCVIVIDTCKSGALKGDLHPSQSLAVTEAQVGGSHEQKWTTEHIKQMLMAKDMESVATAVIFSCQPDEKSWNCLFIKEFIAGLKGKAKLQPYRQSTPLASAHDLVSVDVVTLRNLFEYLKNTITPARNDKDTKQHPILEICSNNRVGDINGLYLALHRNLELQDIKCEQQLFS